MSEEFDVSLAALSGILDAIPEFVIVIDRDGVVRYINRSNPATIGMRSSECTQARSWRPTHSMSFSHSASSAPAHVFLV
jgi:PAS domain-containing protein